MENYLSALLRSNVASKLAYCVGSVSLLLFSRPAFANDHPPLIVSGSATLVSDYRFRGISSTDGDPAIQAEIEVTHQSGFYVGIWGSSQDDGRGLGAVEVDLYGGWSGPIASNLSSDVSLVYYSYPAASGRKGLPTGSFEASLSLTLEGQIVVPSIGISHAWGQEALSGKSNTYVFLDATAAIPNTPITARAHVGYTSGSYAIADDGTNLDWSVGAQIEVTNGLYVGLDYLGIDGPQIDKLTNDSIVLTLSAKF